LAPALKIALRKLMALQASCGKWNWQRVSLSSSAGSFCDKWNRVWRHATVQWLGMMLRLNLFIIWAGRSRRYKYCLRCCLEK